MEQKIQTADYVENALYSRNTTKIN